MKCFGAGRPKLVIHSLCSDFTFLLAPSILRCAGDGRLSRYRNPLLVHSLTAHIVPQAEGEWLSRFEIPFSTQLACGPTTSVKETDEIPA